MPCNKGLFVKQGIRIQFPIKRFMFQNDIVKPLNLSGVLTMASVYRFNICVMGHLTVKTDMTKTRGYVQQVHLSICHYGL